jgi:superfamily I DNA/RNA helicase
LPGALRAAVTVAGLAAQHDDPKQVADDAFYVIRQVFGGRRADDEIEARERAIARLTTLRFLVEEDARPGLYLLTCHSGKGKEFDTVVIPYLSEDIFADDEEGRQLLYVSITRARRRLIVRSAQGHAPSFARVIGLA